MKWTNESGLPAGDFVPAADTAGAAGAAGQAGGHRGITLSRGTAACGETAVGEGALPLEAVTSAELREMLSRAAQYSVHSYTDSLRHGFLTLSGGHRLGICGTAGREEDGRVPGCAGLSSINSALYIVEGIYRRKIAR